MWMIRFIQYPRNSVENLNRALYIKLLKTQWLSDRKFIPFPAGKGRWKFPEITRNEKIIKFKIISFFYVYLFFFVSSSCIQSTAYINFLVVIPEDILNQEFLQTRALCKFSTEFLGCWTNRIVHTSVTVRFIIHYDGANGNRQCQAIFANVTETLHKISLAASPHHLAKCVICIFAKFVCFTNSWKHEKHENDVFHAFAK